MVPYAPQQTLVQISPNSKANSERQVGKPSHLVLVLPLKNCKTSPSEIMNQDVPVNHEFGLRDTFSVAQHPSLAPNTMIDRVLFRYACHRRMAALYARLLQESATLLNVSRASKYCIRHRQDGPFQGGQYGPAGFYEMNELINGLKIVSFERGIWEDLGRCSTSSTDGNPPSWPVAWAPIHDYYLKDSIHYDSMMKKCTFDVGRIQYGLAIKHNLYVSAAWLRERAVRIRILFKNLPQIRDRHCRWFPKTCKWLDTPDFPSPSERVWSVQCKVDQTLPVLYSKIHCTVRDGKARSTRIC